MSSCLNMFLFACFSVPASSKSAGSPGSLQRSRSDVDVNAAASAKARHGGQAGGAGRLTTALPPGTYASLGICSETLRALVRMDPILRTLKAETPFHLSFKLTHLSFLSL